MQVRNVNYNNCNDSNCNKKNSQKQSFGNALVSSVAFIENNGFVGEFFTVDGFGMMAPRTGQAYLRNRKELGHLNYRAGAEEGIREILTGPSMFLIPMGLVLLAGRIFGKATKINMNTLKEFGEITKKVFKKHPDTSNFKNKFYNEALSEAFEPHFKIADQKGKETLEKAKVQIIEILNKLGNNKLKKAEVKKLKAEACEHFVHMNQLFGIKTTTPQIFGLGKEVEVLNKKTNKKTLEKSINVKCGDFIKDLLNYANDKDISKIDSKSSEEASSLLDKTIGNKIGIRKFMTTFSFASVGAFLYAIPLLYKRNKQFPGVDGLVEGQENESVKLRLHKVKKGAEK